METRHRVLIGDSRDLSRIADASVHLVVTSPPYPMVEMWDGLFGALDPGIACALAAGRAAEAFEGMHAVLDAVWRECFRVLVPGGLACINVGDATRTVSGDFQLFANHARIVQAMREIGFTVLPDVLWRKPTNAPNKFMGSGMLPAGAYVTYEHEYVLILRKGARRAFPTPAAKAARRRSAYFWEERNVWFSDVWTSLIGTRQALADPESRARSAAFPFEVPYRLIQMFSVQGDLVLDPFAGVGTTAAAAAASARSSVAVERDPALAARIGGALDAAPALGRERAGARLRAHQDFVAERARAGRPPAHRNRHYGFPVVTGQETELVLEGLRSVVPAPDGTWTGRHEPAALDDLGDTTPDLPFGVDGAEVETLESSDAGGS